MRHLVLILGLGLVLPASIQAEVWRWQDDGGRLHYSNVHGHAPYGAARMTGRVGYLASTMRLPKFSPPAPDPQRAERLESARALQRRLDEIECFRGGVKTRQLARLLRSYPSVQLLPEWLIGDSWLGAHEAELRLQAQLADLEKRTRLE